MPQPSNNSYFGKMKNIHPCQWKVYSVPIRCLLIPNKMIVRRTKKRFGLMPLPRHSDSVVNILHFEKKKKGSKKMFEQKKSSDSERLP